MLIEKSYIINQHMIYMTSYYDIKGNLFTKVNQVDNTILVGMSPLEILEDTIKSIGFDIKGAITSAKWLTGMIQMCPVMVNPIQKICVFATRSALNVEAMWINPAHIARTSRCFNRHTLVDFRNGTSIIAPLRLSAFNHKLQTAVQLKNMTIEEGKHPISFLLEPKKGRNLTKR